MKNVWWWRALLLLASGALMALVGVSGAKPPAAKAQAVVRQEVLSPVVSLQTPIRAWDRRVLSSRVWTAQGRLVAMPQDKPIVFFAWWCPHCHEALLQLKARGLLHRFTFVSVWINDVTPKGGDVTSAKQAKLTTERALHAIGVSLPNVYLAPPASSVNSLLTGVPTVLIKTTHGWREMQGTPSKAAVWNALLTNARG
ncbi:MAG: TlpA family protein disulfide reductase [Bacilli bacterium]